MNDPKINICGVPEHFNYPLKQALQNFPDYKWTDCHGGSGEMIENLKNGKTDLAVMLTEAAVFAILKGEAFEIVSEYVSSPLNWGIYTCFSNPVSLPQIDDVPLLISRKGSGSHLIPFAKAHYNNYKYKPELNEIKNLAGACAYFNAGKKGLFYWEQNTTDEIAKQNNMLKIGSYPTPWPCFVMVKRKDCKINFNAVIDAAKVEAKRLKSEMSMAVILISRAYNLSTSRIERWFSNTEWFKNKLQQSHLNTIAGVLYDQGLVENNKFPEEAIIE